MCLSVPAKVLSVHGDRAIVESRGWRREVNVAHVRARPGGFVLVQGGVAMSVLEPLEAAEIIDAWTSWRTCPMHEATMAQGIVSTVLAEAARRGAHAVRAVDVQVGDLEGLDADALRAAFELEAVGTCAEGATLSIHVTPTRLVCTACGHAWEPRIHRDDPVACPRCAAPARVDGTRGIVIQRAILTTPDGP